MLSTISSNEDSQWRIRRTEYKKDENIWIIKGGDISLSFISKIYETPEFTSDERINPSKASCPIKTSHKTRQLDIGQGRKRRTEKEKHRKSWKRENGDGQTNKWREFPHLCRLDPFCDRSEVKVHPVENQSEKDLILLTADH